jgi:hypothetical protein
MPLSKYLKVTIDGQEMDLEATEKVPVAISYKLEDTEDFQKKKSSEAFDVKFPATPKNDLVGNTFHNPAVEDMSPGESFKGNKPAVIEANGYELLVGKAFLRRATHDSQPIDYTFNFYGNNADWMIDLKEATLFDFLKQINFAFTKQVIIDSWGYNGRAEALPFVFAPVRYGEQMAEGPADPDTDPTLIKDYNMKPEYMKPAISKYWLLYWGFKSLGYRISSQFFDTDYFRRQVMPWTWGNFLYSEGTRLNNIDFLAKSTEPVYFSGGTTMFWDLKVSNDSSNGGFDNNNTYTYDAGTKLMTWTYPYAFNYGVLEATFHLAISVDATVAGNSDVELRIQYFKNGVRVTSHDDNGNGTELVNISAGSPGRSDFVGIVDDFLSILVSPGDIITAKFYLHTFDSGLGRANIKGEVIAFELDYFRVPLNGTIDFQNYAGLKKYKFLDYLRGIVDEFNLSIQTDPINKVVVMEPTHPYAVGNDLSVTAGGYFNGNHIDWDGKQDLSKVSAMDLFSDYDREVMFTYKEDSNDGILKVIQDRNLNRLGAGKYVFPDRFKAGQKAIENRFFSPVMHYEVDQWRGLGSDDTASPQMICMIPENISNTSRSESGNTFTPKSAYYKGLVNDVGWVFDGDKQEDFPFMFAVNYKPGGENDPVLSYSDERIGKYPFAAIGKGLLRRFYLQRLAIMRNGQYYTTSFRLNNLDVTNWFHREHIVCRGQKWELVAISNYKPLLEESTECNLRRWAPITQGDSINTFPSADNLLEITEVLGTYDIKYAPLKALSSDIPTE